MKRKYVICLVQTLGLLCMMLSLYLGWVQQLAADATAIREALGPQSAAQAAGAWHGFSGAVLFALRGPVFWFGLVVAIAAWWLPAMDSRGRRSREAKALAASAIVPRPTAAVQATVDPPGTPRDPRRVPSRGRRPHALDQRVLDPPAPRA